MGEWDAENADDAEGRGGDERGKKKTLAEQRIRDEKDDNAWIQKKYAEQIRFGWRKSKSVF